MNRNYKLEIIKKAAGKSTEPTQPTVDELHKLYWEAEEAIEKAIGPNPLEGATVSGRDPNGPDGKFRYKNPGREAAYPKWKAKYDKLATKYNIEQLRKNWQAAFKAEMGL